MEPVATVAARSGRVPCTKETSTVSRASTTSTSSTRSPVPVRRLGRAHRHALNVRGFHTDNGSEFINHKIAARLQALHIDEFTKSRPRRSNDNALVESKNGSVIRKHLGYGHIPSRYAERVNAFTQQILSPYLNFHRPCLFPVDEVDASASANGQRHDEKRVAPSPTSNRGPPSTSGPSNRHDQPRPTMTRDSARGHHPSVRSLHYLENRAPTARPQDFRQGPTLKIDTSAHAVGFQGLCRCTSKIDTSLKIERPLRIFKVDPRKSIRLTDDFRGQSSKIHTSTGIFEVPVETTSFITVYWRLVSCR